MYFYACSVLQCVAVGCSVEEDSANARALVKYIYMNIHRSMCIHTCTYVSIHTGGGKGECEYKRMGHVGGQELAA